MSFSDSGQPTIIVKGGKYDGDIISVNTEKNKKIRKEIPLNDERGLFRPYPNKTTRIYYLSGASGSGKSTGAAEYIKLYQSKHPKTKVLVFSRLDKDPSIDHIKNMTRVIMDESYLESPPEIEEFVDCGKHVLVLFDDCDTITDKLLLKAINAAKIQIMELGRHFDLQLVITSHLANGNDRHSTRTVMNEMGLWTFFPQSGSWYQNAYTLKNYFGFSTQQINRLKGINTRMASITKHYPQVIITDKFCCFVSDF